MDRSEDDTLLAELRELRPTPRPEFAAELDRRAGAGFPRGGGASPSLLARLVDRWRGLNPARRLVPVLGVALLAIVVGTGAVAISQSGSSGSSSAESSFLSESAPESSSSESAESGEEAGPESSLAAPSASAGLAKESEVGAESSTGSVGGPSAKSAAPQGGRDIERSSYVVLGTKPGEVTGAAKKVYEAVHAAGGYVLDSSVQSGSAGATGASFELSIPTARLDGTLATISAIAEVRERHDATHDITAPTVSVAEELADSNAKIEGLLKQLGEAETEAEQESVEARLREERRHHAAIRASLDQLHQRASMSRVSVRIVTDHGAGVTPPSRGDGNWGVGDALHSAAHILTIAAGVVLIGLAVLAPFALLALLFWTANRVRLRRLRERTLG
jgi:hypothetical protein